MRPSNPSRLVCGKCGSEPAILIRRYSGEVLGKDCLRRSLLDRMRRVVGKFGILSRVDSVTLLRTDVPQDEILADLFVELEKPFDVRIEEVHRPVSDSSSLWDEIVDLIKKERFRNKLVVPLTLDDAVALFLRAIFTGSPHLLLVRGVVFLGLSRVNAVSPFTYLPLEEVLALIHPESEEDRRGILRRYVGENPYLRMLEELELSYPGTRFNIVNSLERDDLAASMGIVFSGVDRGEAGKSERRDHVGEGGL